VGTEEWGNRKRAKRGAGRGVVSISFFYAGARGTRREKSNDMESTQLPEGKGAGKSQKKL